MDYKDIMWVKTGEMLTKETFEKYLKEDPNGLVIMHHIKEEDMLAAFRHPGTWIGSDGMPFTDSAGKPLPLVELEVVDADDKILPHTKSHVRKREIHSIAKSPAIQLKLVNSIVKQLYVLFSEVLGLDGICG